MDLMTRRRALLARVESGGIDTSPVIVQTGVHFGRGNGLIVEEDGWAITDWIYFDPVTPTTPLYIVDAYASLSRLTVDGGDCSYQYESANGIKDWFYGSTDFTEFARSCPLRAPFYRIRWSVKLENINRCYAFCQETGQIFFAGRNSIYYGHHNINELN